MDKLANYGSDDDCDESPRHEEKTDYRERANPSSSYGSTMPKTTDTNYDDVGMDLSEDSDDSNKGSRPKTEETRDRDRKRERRDSPKTTSRNRNRHEDEERTRDRDRHDRDRQSTEHRDERYREDRYKSRDRDRDRDRERDERREKSRSRDERRARRSNSHERHRSRSPSNWKDWQRRGSGEQNDRKYGYSRRYEKATNKMAHLEKMGIELKSPEKEYVPERREGEKGNTTNESSKFFLPGVTGRLREQMERRKLLWQKKEAPETTTSHTTNAGPSKPGKVWESTTFAQDQDGKQASKFKRLMGIRDSSSEGGGKSTSDIVKKQEELFSSMEQQYEVARTATHTMRGVGLGFGSFQR